MSAMSKLADLYTATIKKAFPDPQPPLIRRIAALSTTYTAATPGNNHQTDATGITSLTLTPVAAASNTGIIVCWGAPSNTIAKAWLDDTTADSDILEYVYIAPGETRTIVFGSPVLSWDMKALGAVCDVYQEKAR